MKKILLIIVAIGLFSVNAMAMDGKVTQVTVKANGAIFVQVTPIDTNLPAKNKILVGTADAKKAMLATVLTAKSTDSIVSTAGGTFDGLRGWIVMSLK